MVSAVARRNLPSQVVEQIGRSIVSGVFAEGATLPNEAILAGDLGVSRNVLREAVKVLVSKGMLEVRPKVGTTVRPKEFWYMLDPAVLAWEVSGNLHLPHLFNFCEFRLIVEPKAAFLAAQRASDEDIREIRAACARLEACVNRFAEMPEADIAFHQTIHRASHNAVLQHLAKMTVEIMRAQVNVTAGVPGDFLRGLPLHRGVTDAITARDAPRAEALSRALCEMPYLDLAARLADGGLAPDLVIDARSAIGQEGGVA
jgi:DNA-binding FadR family transcriptional regulator